MTECGMGLILVMALDAALRDGLMTSEQAEDLLRTFASSERPGTDEREKR